jgi:transposase
MTSSARALERIRVERRFSQLKRRRAIATRHDNLGSHYAALLPPASVLLWL